MNSLHALSRARLSRISPFPRAVVRWSSAPSLAEATSGTDTNRVSVQVKNEWRESIRLETANPLNVYPAVNLLKKHRWAKFDETVEIAVNLDVDPRKPNQTVKGVAPLPHGTGKTIRVAVFARNTDVDAALAAGADVVGTEDLIDKIQGGDVNFDTIIATPDLMAVVGKVGRILGPRGIMPNPKMGTVTTDVATAVRKAKDGAVQFKVEKKGIIQAGIGKQSFTNQKLLDNIRSFMTAVIDAKPEGFKGKYIKAVHLTTTMGPSIAIDVSTVDPSNGKFMLDPDAVSKSQR